MKGAFFMERFTFIIHETKLIRTFTLWSRRTKLIQFSCHFRYCQLYSEVVVNENPLMVGELPQVSQRYHLDQFERGQQQVRVSWHLVLQTDLHILLGKYLHQQGQNHGPDVDKELVEGNLGQLQNQDSNAEQNQNQQRRMGSLWQLNDIWYFL